MDRREFIKKGLCIGCAGFACAGAAKLFNSGNFDSFNHEDITKSPFYISSDDQLPKQVKMDMTSVCQLNCPRCWKYPYTKEELEKFPHGHLSFENFKKFIDRNPQISTLFLSSSGEMVLNPDFCKIINYAESKDIVLYACSGANLNYLTDEIAEAIVTSGIEVMSISIDGASQDTYKIYRVGGNFDNVIKNVQLINHYKKKYNMHTPILEWQFIVFGHNEHEIEKAAKMAADLDMQIVYMPNYAPEYSPVKNPERVKELTGLFTLDALEYTFNSYVQDKVSGWIYCSDFKKSPAIDILGNFYTCCVKFPKGNFGLNFFENDMKTVLNNPVVIKTKEFLADYSIKDKSIICSDCYVYDFLKKKNYYIFEK